jgi:hypothetical protein
MRGVHAVVNVPCVFSLEAERHVVLLVTRLVIGKKRSDMKVRVDFL